MVVVALGEPGVPVIYWAGAGRATNITAAAVSSDKPLWINFRFIVFLVLDSLRDREKSVSLHSRRRMGEMKRRSASAARMAGRRSEARRALTT
jgi:hypothetical protein